MPSHTPKQNDLIARLFCGLKEECVWQHNFKDLAEAPGNIVSANKWNWRLDLGEHYSRLHAPVKRGLAKQQGPSAIPTSRIGISLVNH